MTDMIELNVGGQKFTTQRETLVWVPNSRLASWFKLGNNATTAPSKDVKVGLMLIMMIISKLIINNLN